MLKLHIKDIFQNGVTGHIDAHVHIVEETEHGEEEGPVEVHGINPLALEHLYGKDEANVQKWLQHVKEKAFSNHAMRKSVKGDLEKLKGTRI